MGLGVTTNLAAVSAHRHLSISDGHLGRSLERLSSGMRINRAADDAAGLAISEGLRSQIGGLKVALLPKENRGDAVTVTLTLRMGDLKSLAGRHHPPAFTRLVTELEPATRPPLR